MEQGVHALPELAGLSGLSGHGLLGVYVHVPFCVSRCHYCDFVSYAIGRESTVARRDMDGYLTALLQEACIYRGEKLLTGQIVQSLYIGGGTPTCLTGGQLFTLLDSLRKVFELPEGTEITVEANPGTLDAAKIQVLRNCGCNRLSLGVQSFDPAELNVLGRIHTPQEVFATYNLAREAGFTNINLDLMYGIPGQDLPSWCRNLELAANLQPEHLSLYQLNIEKGTPFYALQARGELPEVEQEVAWEMYETAISFLDERGYNHYEISNFARNGKESIHNRIYWRQEEYIGLGAGASGYLRGSRYTNAPDLKTYCEGVSKGQRPVQSEERIEGELARGEFMFLGLRLLEGVAKARFYERFRADIKEIYGEAIDRLKSQGLLEESETHVFLSKRGLSLANHVFMEFLP